MDHSTNIRKNHIIIIEILNCTLFWNNLRFRIISNVVISHNTAVFKYFTNVMATNKDISTNNQSISSKYIVKKLKVFHIRLWIYLSMTFIKMTSLKIQQSL